MADVTFDEVETALIRLAERNASPHVELAKKALAQGDAELENALAPILIRRKLKRVDVEVLRNPSGQILGLKASPERLRKDAQAKATAEALIEKGKANLEANSTAPEEEPAHAQA